MNGFDPPVKCNFDGPSRLWFNHPLTVEGVFVVTRPPRGQNHPAWSWVVTSTWGWRRRGEWKGKFKVRNGGPPWIIRSWSAGWCATYERWSRSDCAGFTCSLGWWISSSSSWHAGNLITSFIQSSLNLLGCMSATNDARFHSSAITNQDLQVSVWLLEIESRLLAVYTSRRCTALICCFVFGPMMNAS